MKLVTGVITAVVDGGDVLLINRAKPPFLGYWGLPGGKIEFGEHPEETAIREIKEEAGIDAEVVGMRGVLSEVVRDKDSRDKVEHFLLFVCEMKAISKDLVESEEGRLKWFSMKEIEKEPLVVPSDVSILKDMIFSGDKQMPIHRSHLLRSGQEYHLESFTS